MKLKVKLNCNSCPARPLRTDIQLAKIERWESMRESQVKKLHLINLYLLGESIPANKFIYDPNSKYLNSGIRHLMKIELGIDSDEEFFDFLNKNGILIADCAFCPLHKLESEQSRIDAATICLSRHTKGILNINPEAPIITFFPKGKGFDKPQLPEIQDRIVGSFQFSRLSGLKDLINNIITTS